MTTFRCRARWVLPIARRPIPDGVLTVARDRIVSVEAEPDGEPAPIDLGAVAVLPGLVNAHTHLELSSLRGRVARSRTVPDWVRALMQARSAAPESLHPIEEAVSELRCCGTALVGDVSNTLASAGPLAAGDVSARLFYELVGFAVEDARSTVSAALDRLGGIPASDRLRGSLAAHAPYSVSPALLAAIRAAIDAPDPLGVHLGESAEEREFLSRGTGPWRRLLDDLGAWNPGWRAPGCGPVEYLERCRFLGPGLVAAHAVQLREPELERLAATGGAVVTCPRSNAWTGAGRPDVERFYRAGVPVAIGTDSLASCPDLNLFQELAALRRLAPAVPAPTLLRSATEVGAHVLGFHDELGTIEPGRRAALIAVDLPDGIQDVEEYLMSGIEPEQVHWLDESGALGE